MNAIVGKTVTAMFRDEQQEVCLTIVGLVVAIGMNGDDWPSPWKHGPRDRGPRFRVLVYCQDGEYRNCWADDCLPMPGSYSHWDEFNKDRSDG